MTVKEANRILREIDNKKEDKKFNKWLMRECEDFGYFLKSGKTIECKNTGYKKRYEKKINKATEEYCEKCKRLHRVIGKMTKTKEIEEHVAKFEKFKDEIIVRYYYIRKYTDFEDNYNNCTMTEYMRKVGDENYKNQYLIESYYYGDRIKRGDYGKRLLPKWSKLWQNWDYYSRIYPGNLKEILGDSIYKYEGIEELAKRKVEVSPTVLMKVENIRKVEMAVKNKWYEIINQIDKINLKEEKVEDLKKGAKYNLSYDNYKIMKATGVTDKKELEELGRKLGGYFADYEKIKDFWERRKDKDKMKEYIINQNRFSISEYEDYITMAKTIGYDTKDKKYKYPENLTEAHNKMIEEYNEKKDEIRKEKIKEIGKELEKNEWRNEGFVIRPIKTIDELYEESRQMRNCVKTYVDKIVKGESEIYVMRKEGKEDESYITVEIRKGKICQALEKCNKKIKSKKAEKVLKEWEAKLVKC